MCYFTYYHYYNYFLLRQNNYHFKDRCYNYSFFLSMEFHKLVFEFHKFKVNQKMNLYLYVSFVGYYFFVYLNESLHPIIYFKFKMYCLPNL